MEGKEGRTEPATAKRRDERRKKGDLCVSMEIVTISTLFLGFLGLRWAVPRMGGQLVDMWREMSRIPVGADVTWDASKIQEWFRSGTMFLGLLLAPIVVPTTLGTIIANMAQTGPNLSTEALAPKFNLLNPVNGIRQLFSTNTLFSMGMDLLKMLLIACVLYVILRNQFATIMTLSSWSLDSFEFWLFRLLFMTAMSVVSVFIVLAGIDYAYRHHTYEKNMMMTKKEVEDERKNQELPAVVKGAQRKRMRDLTMLRMMAAIPEANVIITNPTHVAVAIQYDPAKMSAPRVVAKGLRLVAQRIKEIAKEHDVPIIEKPEVARSLYKNVKVGHQIPSQFFGAVAEILAYLYKLGNQRMRQTVAMGRVDINNGPATNKKGNTP